MPRGEFDHAGPRGPYQRRYAWAGGGFDTALRAARLRLRHTQAVAAEKIGVSRSLVAMIESGKREQPSNSTPEGRAITAYLRESVRSPELPMGRRHAAQRRG